jgi:hypothetical protein
MKLASIPIVTPESPVYRPKPVAVRHLNFARSALAQAPPHFPIAKLCVISSEMFVLAAADYKFQVEGSMPPTFHPFRAADTDQRLQFDPMSSRSSPFPASTGISGMG